MRAARRSGAPTRRLLFAGRGVTIIYMTAETVIEEIKRLPPREQLLVLQFAGELTRQRRLSGAELTALGEELAAAREPAEVARLNAALLQGFYGA